MSIQYGGGTIVNSTFTTGSGSPSTDLLLELIDALDTAGWTQTDTPAQVIGTFSGQPSNNDTITLDSSPNQKVYRFRTSGAGLAQANDVLIDVDAATTYSNLVAAITLGAGSGTKYFASTLLNVNMTATSDATTITIAYKTAGSDGNGAPVAESTSNFTWASGTLSEGYTFFVSAQTPQGLKMGIKLFTAGGGFYTPGTTISIFPTTYDLSLVSTVDLQGGVVDATQSWQIIANRYQLFAFTPGTAANFLSFGIPYLQSPLVAPVISSATNTTPIVCTVAAHGFTTGQDVYNTGAIGNTGVNGPFPITVLDANTFELDTSVGNGTYTANSARCANTTQAMVLAEAIWGSGSGSTNFRKTPYCSKTFTSLNGAVNNNNGTQNIGQLQMLMPIFALRGTTNDQQWVNNNYLMFEPVIGVGISVVAVPKIFGQMWDSCELSYQVATDQTATFDGHNFIAVGTGGLSSDNISWSLFLATS